MPGAGKEGTRFARMAALPRCSSMPSFPLSVDHIIIVIYINGVCYRGSSEMSQIHVQLSHFSDALASLALIIVTD